MDLLNHLSKLFDEDFFVFVFLHFLPLTFTDFAYLFVLVFIY